MGDPLQWRAIAKLNEIRNPDYIVCGQELVLPLQPCLESTGIGQRVSQTFKQPAAVAQQTRPRTTELLPARFTQPAIPVLSPAFRYDFDAITPIKGVAPGFTYKLSLKGEVTLQDTSLIQLLTFTKEGIEAEYKRKLDTAFSMLSANAQIKVDAVTESVEFSIGFTRVAKYEGRELTSTEVMVIVGPPPDDPISFATAAAMMRVAFPKAFPQMFRFAAP